MTELPAPLMWYREAQLMSACAFGIWWVLLSPVILATLGPKGIAGARVSYNAALFLVSPAAGGAVERGDVLKMLIWPSLGRVVVYAALPALWILVRSRDSWEHYYSPLFFALMVIDGAFVALVNVASIDCGGTDLVAARLGLENRITDEIRDRFNSLHQLFLDGSMVLGAPVVAIACFVVAMRYHGHAGQALSLLLALGGTFLLCFGGSVVLYARLLAAAPSRTAPGDPKAPGFISQAFAALGNLPADARYVAKLDPRLLWRVFFLAIDTAVEDAVIAVVLPTVANQLACRPNKIDVSGYLHNCDGQWRLRGGVFLAVTVAVGKLGGVAAGVLMHKRAAAHAAEGDAHYRRLFRYALLAGLSFLGLPAVLLHLELGRIPTYALLCLVVLLFFFLMTLPKIGFATLLQNMACASEAPGRVFGFTASFVMVVDSLVVGGLSLCAPSERGVIKLATSLWISAGLVAGVGLFEGLFGPALVLGPASDAAGAPGANDAGRRSSSAGQSMPPAGNDDPFAVLDDDGPDARKPLIN